MWSTNDESRDGDSSISSGRLSCSSGGHDSSDLPLGYWRERPPQVLGSLRQPRKNNPRLEQLRDKIRLQAEWQSSCASLTSARSGSFTHLKDPVPVQVKTPKPGSASQTPVDTDFNMPNDTECEAVGQAVPGQDQESTIVAQHQTSAPREKARRLKSCSYKNEKSSKPAASRGACKDRDSELVGVYAWRKGRALVRALLGPPPALPRLFCKALRRHPALAADLGSNKKGGAARRPIACSSMSTSCSDQKLSAQLPNLTFCDQSVTIQTAMAILRDLRQQIQSGLELARSRHCRGLDLLPSKLRLKDLMEKVPPDSQGSFSRNSQTRAEGKPSSLERTGKSHARQRRSVSTGLEPCRREAPTAKGQVISVQRPGSPPEGLSNLPQRPWSAGQDFRPQRSWAARAWSPSSLRPRSPTERLSSFPQRPWSASAGQTSSSRRTWAVPGQDFSSQRLGSPPGRSNSFRQRPWSALAGQASGPQRAFRVTFDDNWEPPTHSPGSPPARRSWSASLAQKPGTRLPGRGSLLLPSETKLAWSRPSRSDLWKTVRKETDGRSPPPCPKPRDFLGHPYSSESLREFMRQKAVARRRQAQEEKASAVRALELRNQRLLDVYRKQQEAVLGKVATLSTKAAPLVSQTTPGIVTFVPHSSQPRDLETSSSSGGPVRVWSKVTSGTVLGNQEAPDSFCLCLNRALNQTETGDLLDDCTGVPVLVSADSSQGPLRLRDLTHCGTRPGWCIYLNSKEAERLGMASPLQFRYKQARVQALEAMANILQQRIDLLTTKLRRMKAATTLGDLGLERPSSSPSPVSAVLTSKAPCCTKALVHNEKLPGSGHPAGRPPGFEESLECAKLEKRLARHSASLRALSNVARSSHRVMSDPPCGSLCLEDLRASPRLSLVTPWTVQNFGQHNPDQLSPGHLASIQQKSLSFLESLKLGQQKQVRALALLRQRVEMEVLETQKALDQLLFKRQSERPMGWHSAPARPKPASGQEQLENGDLEPPTSLGPSAVTPRSQAQLDGDPSGTGTSRAPEKGQESQVDTVTSSEPLQKARLHHVPSQLHQPRLFLQDKHKLQVQMLEQSLRDEELHAQHQDSLLLLREKALEEKTNAELAFLQHQREWEHQRGFLSNMEKSTVLMALEKMQQQVLSKHEQELRKIRYLQSISQLKHQERMLLLQHQRDTALVQRAVTQLRQEFCAQPRLLQNPNPEDKAAASANERLGGPVQDSSYLLTSLPSGSPSSHSLWRNPKAPRVSHLPTEWQDEMAPRADESVDGHLRSPLTWRPAWEEVTPAGAGGPIPVSPGRLVEKARHRHTSQEPEVRPHVPLLGLQEVTAPDIEQPLGPTFPVGEEEGGLSAAQFQLLEGDPRTNRSPSSAEKTQAPLESQAESFQIWRRPSSSGREGPHSPLEASAVEGSVGRMGVELGLECANGSMREPPETENRRTGDQRSDSCWKEDLDTSTQLETARLGVSTASREAAQFTGGPLPPLVAEDLSSESVSPPGTCSVFSAGSSASSVSDLSWPSLQEFQKASAVLVQLSQSSLSDWEAGATAATNPGWPRNSGGPLQDVGQGTCEQLGGTDACPLQGLSPVAGDPEPDVGPLSTGWPELLPEGRSPRSGSELSAASSQVWDEEKQPKLGSSRCSSPVEYSSDLESCEAPSSLGPGEGKEVSGTSGSLSGGSNTGKSKQASPEAASPAFPGSTSSSSDLDVSPSFLSGTPVSKVSDFGKEEIRSPQALTGCLEGLQDATTSPSVHRKHKQASPEAEVPVSLQASPDPGGVATPAGMSLTPRHGDSRAPLVPEEAPAARPGRALPEILSPVDEVLSYGSADLPSSTLRDAHLPPPPLLPPESEANVSPCSEDFPSPPADSALSLGGWLSPQGEDTSLEADLPSLSGEDLPEPLSPGAQGLGLCLGLTGQQKGLEGNFNRSSSGVGGEAVRSEPVYWPGFPLSGQEGSAPGAPSGLSLQSLSPEAGDSVLVTEDTGSPDPVQEDSTHDVGAGSHAGPHGMETAEAVDLVSTQLSRRILCDTMTVLSGLVQSGSPLGEEPAGATQVLGTQTEASGKC